MKRYFERSKASATRHNKARHSKGALRARSLRLESLENREMLSVTTAEYAEISETYPSFNLPSYEDCNIIEIQADSISLESLKSAIEAAKSADDALIVARTTSSSNTITYTDSTDTLDFGDYTGSITLVGYGEKALTLNAASLTGVITVSASDSSASLNLGNLVLKGGAADNGGAINSENVSLTVALTTISGSNATEYGGGVYVEGGELTLVDTKFTSNTAAVGGAICVIDSELYAMSSTFMFNRSSELGGAVCSMDSEVVFTSGVFSYNTAATSGGAMYLASASDSITLVQTNFTGNTATNGAGGAIVSFAEELDLVNNIFLANKSGSAGGAICTYGGLNMADALFMSNSAVDGGAIYAWNNDGVETPIVIGLSNFQLNTATGEGGALYLDYPAAITTSQFARNTSSANGGAIYAAQELAIDSTYIAANTAENGAGLYTNGSVALVNDTIVDNTATSGGAWYNLDGEIEVYNSILLGNGAAAYVNQGTTAGAYNLLETESELADLTDSIVYDSTAALFTARDSRDYTLVEDSQAINLGSNSYVVSETDLSGNKRISKRVVDLGAYEYQFDDDDETIELESVAIDGSLTVNSTLTAEVTPGSATVTLQWYRAESADADEWTAIDGATEDEYVLTSEDVGYYINVVATGYDDYEGEVSAISDAAVTAELNVPTNLTVTGTTAYTVSLEWDAVDGAATYQIAYTTSDDNLWNIVSVDASQTTCVIENLTPKTSYQIKIKAVAQEDAIYSSSDYSDEVTAVTAAIQELESVAITGDVAVGVTLVATVTPEDATVTWQWYRATALVDEPWIALDNATAATYLVTTDDLGYYFKIVATGYGEFDGIVEAITEIAASQTLSTPEYIAVTDVTTTSISVYWSEVENASGYKLAYCVDGEDEWTQYVGDASTTIYDLTGLTPDTTYLFKVQALGDGDLYVESDYSEVIAVTTAALTQLEEVVLSGVYAVGEEIVATVSPEDADATYRWLRAESSDSEEWTVIDGAEGVSYVLTSDDLGMYVKVVATASGEYTGEAQAVTDVVYTVLNAPTGLTAVATSDTTIDVSWDAVENATAYQLKYKLTTEEDQPTAWESVTLLNGATSLTIEELDAETTYDFKVMAFGDSVVYMNSEYSDVVNATTEEEPDPALTQIVLTGTKAVGEYLFTTLAPTDATATYAWYRGDGENWTQIEDSDAVRYKLTEEDFGYYVRVVATGTGEYTGEVEAVTTKAIMKKIGTVSISGNTYEGETLTAILSTKGAADNATYSWYRGDGETWTKISGANEQTYVLTSEEVGAYIMVKATGVNGYTNSGEAVTDTVVEGELRVQGVTIKGTRAVDARLYAYVTPSNAEVTYQWYRGQDDDWTAIDGATSYYYKQNLEDFGYYIKVVATGVGEYTGTVEATTTKATMRLIGSASIQGDLYVGKSVTVELTTDGAAENATYSWYRGDGETWTKIAGASSQSYTLTDDDLGYYVKARAVGKNGYTNSAEAVSETVVDLPSMLDSVTISGSRLVGAYLVATVEPEEAGATYQWYRGDGEEWTAIDGATSRVYTQTDDDFGYYIRVVATGAGEYGGDVEAVTTKKTMKSVGTATLDGYLYVGKTVTVQLSSEGAADVSTISWYRGDGATWTKIAGATESTYELTDADLGYYIKARVVGANGYTSSAEVVSDSVIAEPTWLDSVTISGTRLVGAYLIATAAPEDATVSYQWYRGDGEEWIAIAGATSRGYTQTEDDFGSYLRVVATGEGEFGGSVEAITSKITMKTVGVASLSGSAVVGSELTVTLSADGAGESATYSWYRGDGKTWTKIAGANAASYTLTSDDLGYYVKSRAVGKSGFTSSSEATTEGVVAQADANALLDLALAQLWDDDLGLDL